MAIIKLEGETHGGVCMAIHVVGDPGRHGCTRVHVQYLSLGV